jgi:hypothetical protein
MRRSSVRVDELDLELDSALLQRLREIYGKPSVASDGGYRITWKEWQTADSEGEERVVEERVDLKVSRETRVSHPRTRESILSHLSVQAQLARVTETVRTSSVRTVQETWPRRLMLPNHTPRQERTVWTPEIERLAGPTELDPQPLVGERVTVTVGGTGEEYELTTDERGIAEIDLGRHIDAAIRESELLLHIAVRDAAVEEMIERGVFVELNEARSRE